MGIVAIVEGTDEHGESGDIDRPAASTPPDAPDRPWRHPSEVGLDERVQSDKRRGVGMVIAFVGVTGAVLLGAVALSNLASTDSDRLDSDPIAQSPLAATVELESDAGSRRAIAALVEDGGHALASASELGQLDGVEITVASGEHTSPATAIAVDAETDLVLLELREPLPSGDVDHAQVQVGGDFVFTYLDHMGHMDSDTVVVESTETQALRANGSVAVGLMGLGGWTDHHGPLTDFEGRFAGWVFPAKGAQMYAYDAEYVNDLAESMAGSG